jgi:hypothetical protein
MAKSADYTIIWKHTGGAPTDPSIEWASLNAFRESALSSLVEAGTPVLHEGGYSGYSFRCEYKPLEKENLMYVYDVVVISKQSDGIVFDSYIVARSKDAAKLLALAQIMRDVNPTDEQVDDYHFAISQVGDGYTK